MYHHIVGIINKLRADVEGEEVWVDDTCCLRGLNIKTNIKPIIINRRRKMQARRPVLFWYLEKNSYEMVRSLFNIRCFPNCAEGTTHFSPTSKSSFAWSRWTNACSILYSTLSRIVPWSMTRVDKSLNRTASSVMEDAIWAISWFRCENDVSSCVVISVCWDGEGGTLVDWDWNKR